MKHFYILSGLAADEQAFLRIDFGKNDVHFLKWIQPQKNESIESYACRLSGGITHKDPVLVGLSFGGMMCIEIAKQITTSGVIIISSIKTYKEMPRWMRLAGAFRLNRIFPMKPFKFLEPFGNYNLGVKNKEEKLMVNAYRRNVDRRYLEWAIDVILNWKNTRLPPKIFHIHGSSDRIFNMKKIKCDYRVENAGHMMVFDRSEDVNKCLNEILLKLAC
ncbi:hypothetical protein BH09BAC2_BH09BAC2_10620 [soil metagenome]